MCDFILYFNDYVLHLCVINDDRGLTVPAKSYHNCWQPEKRETEKRKQKKGNGKTEIESSCRPRRYSGMRKLFQMVQQQQTNEVHRWIT